ncbi:MAG: phosphotransferase [Pseudomonadales bacterium]
MDQHPPDVSRTQTLTRIVLNLVPDWRADEVGDFEYLSGGYSNENYRFHRSGEAFVLRVPERVRPFVNRTLEAAFYGGDHSVRTAELIALDTRSGCLITRFEPGPLLADAKVSASEIAAYLRNLHDALPSSGRTYDPVRLVREYLAAGTPPDAIRRLADSLEWRPGTVGPCHNDLNPWNVLVSAAGPWVTLDWEWHGDNDPLFDLVTLHQSLGLDGASLEDLSAAYLGHPGDRKRLQACLTAFWLREYAWAFAEHLHGNPRPEIEAQMSLAATRLSALQSATSSG